jgi:ribosomal protein S18 acetylase RimI-like enzyme
MTYQIVPMQISDYPRLVALWKACPGVGLSSADEPQAIDVFLKRNSTTCFCAWDGERLAGTVLAGHDGRRAYLYHVAVNPADRRKGLGNQLVKTALDALKAEGIQKCHIFVFAQNEDGLKFWRDTGWAQRHDLVILSHNIS